MGERPRARGAGRASAARLAHDPTDELVRLSERHPLLHQPLGQVRRSQRRRAGRSRHRLRVERRRCQQASQRCKRAPDLVDSVKKRFFVLLQVPVICEREPLQRRQEPGQMADQTARFATCQFGNVCVLLLGEHRAAGRIGVVQVQEAELFGRPEHYFLAEAREVGAQERKVKERLGHEVTVRDCVQ